MCGSSVLRLQLFHLFHHWFEECGLRITISDLVLTSKQSYLVNACVLKRLHLLFSSFEGCLLIGIIHLDL